jgi:hypothetical protein
VLGRSLDELPPQTRRVLGVLDAWVTGQAEAGRIERGAVRFTRRTVRGVLGLSDTQLRVHLDRLVQLEYVRLHSGQNGSLYTYSLLFDGDAQADGPQAMGLSDEAAAAETAPTSRSQAATSRGKTLTLRGESADLAGTLRPARGGLAAPLRPKKSTTKPVKTRVNGHAPAESSANAPPGRA